MVFADLSAANELADALSRICAAFKFAFSIIPVHNCIFMLVILPVWIVSFISLDIILISLLLMLWAIAARVLVLKSHIGESPSLIMLIILPFILHSLLQDESVFLGKSGKDCLHFRIFHLGPGGAPLDVSSVFLVEGWHYLLHFFLVNWRLINRFFVPIYSFYFMELLYPCRLYLFLLVFVIICECRLHLDFSNSCIFRSCCNRFLIRVSSIQPTVSMRQ